MILLVPAALFCLGMGSGRGIGQGPLTIESLYKKCGMPVSCDRPIPWEGMSVTIQGQLDPNNIFDKRSFPQLPYEKFRLIGNTGATVEIWPQAGDNRAIFDKLAKRPSEAAIVNGRLVSFKMPMSGQCQVGLKVVIEHETQIQFKALQTK